MPNTTGAKGVGFKPRTAHPQADTPPDINEEEYESADFVMIAPLSSARKDTVISSYKKTLGKQIHLLSVLYKLNALAYESLLMVFILL